MSKYEPVIGLEVHVQLGTDTKIFCGCANQFGSAPNTNTCPVCLGLPGSLPVVNKRAIEFAVKIGHALNCSINEFVKFDRKNYFYPDCPKDYQISQFDFPICANGFINIPQPDGSIKRIGITRAHLEEDAGKLIHESDGSLVDYNRTGTPLLEIVSEPDLRTPQEAYDYLQVLKQTLLYLDVSDCDMEKGSLRCDANISIRPKGQTAFGTKTEIKNMNSFKAVKAGLEYEINRHTQILDAGESIHQETRLWDETKQMTAGMRSKEEAHDYRYFPEPDLVPFILAKEKIEEIKNTLPELPEAKLKRFTNDHGLNDYDATILIQDRHLADFFEACAKQYKDSKKIANWINGAVLKEINERKTAVKDLNLTPDKLISLIQRTDDGTISALVAKDVLKFVIDTGKAPEEVIKEKGLAQVSDTGELETIVKQLFTEHTDIVEQIRGGKASAVGFLVGQAMKKTSGKANPKIINEIIRRELLNG